LFRHDAVVSEQKRGVAASWIREKSAWLLESQILPPLLPVADWSGFAIFYVGGKLGPLDSRATTPWRGSAALCGASMRAGVGPMAMRRAVAGDIRLTGDADAMMPWESLERGVDLSKVLGGTALGEVLETDLCDMLRWT